MLKYKVLLILLSNGVRIIQKTTILGLCLSTMEFSLGFQFNIGQFSNSILYAYGKYLLFLGGFLAEDEQKPKLVFAHPQILL